MIEGYLFGVANVWMKEEKRDCVYMYFKSFVFVCVIDLSQRGVVFLFIGKNEWVV